MIDEEDSPSGITWEDFFRRLLHFKSVDEVEQGMREMFAEGEMLTGGGKGKMTAQELEYRIEQVRRLAAKRGQA